jgi:hypothetical protein
MTKTNAELIEYLKMIRPAFRHDETTSQGRGRLLLLDSRPATE